MRRFFPNGFIIAAAVIAALLLTLLRPSPEGLISLGFGDREVRAAPGQVAVKKHDLSALDVFNMTLMRIRDAYVDPSRIDPKKMLFQALDSVQFNIPEVLVEAYPERDEVVVMVNDQKQTFSTKDVDSPWRLSGALKRIFRFIEAHMNPGADLAEVEYAAINGMLTTLDPHSVLLDPETAREMDVNTSGKFGGLGIVIRMYERKLTIIRPMKDTPASEAGLQRGDHIVKIDDEPTEHLTLSEAVDRMRGTPNTPVTLWIKRKDVKDILRFDLNRAIIRIESVESRMLDNKIGYIKLKQFSGRSEQEISEAIDELKKQGAKGWVFDLRSNPGGLLEQAIAVSDLFLDSGTIVTTVGGREREPRRAERKNTDHLPMAVLVNGNSASASEIVAGALKNLDRAIIIGATTFGKGSVQVLYDNKDGSKLKLTIAQYLTPGDRSIQSVGIVPDIELHRMLVPQKNDSHNDYLRLLDPSRSYKEKDLEAHLTSRYAKDKEKPVYQLSYLWELPKRDELEEIDEPGMDPREDVDMDDDFTEDYEIKLARDLVAGSKKGTRTAMIAAARGLLERHRAKQQEKLAQALRALGVDWSEAPAGHVAPEIETTVAVDKQRYNAGEVVEVTGTVVNRGTVPAYQVHARATSDDYVFSDSELVFGKVAPGETRTFTTRVRIPKDTADRVDQLDVAFTQDEGKPITAKPARFRIAALERPVFAYSHQLLDDGNGDGLVQKGESHRLRMTVKNTGRGASGDTTALLRNASGDGVILEKARFELGTLAPGESKTVEFDFDITEQLREEEVVIEMTVYDNELRESVVEKLRYSVAGASAGPAAASGYARVTSGDTPVYEGASASSGVIATAKVGSGFPITGQQGGWYRVELESGRPGFIADANVTRSRSKPSSSALTPKWQVTPPSISVTNPSYTTAAPVYSLSGVVNDDTHVEDVYVFVSNYADKVENKKVYYHSNRKGARQDTLEFSTEVPLWPGTNRITVVARENDDVKSTYTFFVLRTSNETASIHP